MSIPQLRFNPRTIEWVVLLRGKERRAFPTREEALAAYPTAVEHMTPTVHLNGTSRAELVRQLTEASRALKEAQAALADAAPNGRDYYPQGAHAIQVALREHESRLHKVVEVTTEIDSILEAVSEVGR